MKNVTNIEKKIEGKEWESAIKKAFDKIKKDVKVDGFRKGTVPYDMYIKKYGIESLYNEAIDELLRTVYPEVIKDSKKIPVVEPKVDIKEIDDKHIVFEFIIIERPEVKLGKYKSLGIKKETAKVTKEEIDEEIKHQKEHLAEIVVKEKGKVEKGNTAIIDFDGYVDGKPLEGGKGENYPLEIGSNTFIPGFEDGLIGLKAGEEKELKLKFPENYTEELKNKDVIFKVKVNTIKERVLPELSKEFYEDLGYDDIKTEAEFKDKIKESIKSRKEVDIENKFIDECLEKAVANAKLEINEEIIDDEVHRMMNQAEQTMRMQGITLEQYMEFTKTTHEDLHKQMEPDAIKRVKERFVLEAIAEAEKIEIKDKDAEKRADEMAENYQMTKEDFLKEFGGLEIVKYDMKMREAINIVKGE